MKLVVLCDNCTLIDQYYLSEPALSFYLEDGDRRILFDMGYSDVMMKNARKMNIDLDLVDTIVFSHGHNDHTQGLKYFQEKHDISQKTVIAHPVCFDIKYNVYGPIGAPYQRKEMEERCKLVATDQPYWVTEHLLFLGEIPITQKHEPRTALCMRQTAEGDHVEDILLDDTALVYRDERGIFVITGCSHSGICNIIEYAKKICNTQQVRGVIGGFHLMNLDDRAQETIRYFKENQIPVLYPCHCVSLPVKAQMCQSLPVEEVGVGLQLEI